MNKTTCLSFVTASLVALSLPAMAQTAASGRGGARPTAQTAGGGRGDARPTAQTGSARAAQLKAAHGFDAAHQSPQGFSVVLVLGDLQGGTTSDNVPAAARKALGDMKDFLPYKGYRLLDVQWTLCCSSGPNTSVVSRLRGAEGQEYELSLSTSADSRGRLGVRFLLREPSGQAGPADATSEVVVHLQREGARLEQELDAATKKAQARHEVGVGGPVDEDRNIQGLRSRLAEINIRTAEARRDQRTTSQGRSLKTSVSPSVIDTSFTMAVGETVVVGTSRVAGGEKALIALLTAVPQKPNP